MKNKILGSALAVIGFLLSPLSWWNDIFINIPIAYLFASLIALLNPNLFFSMMIFGYWLTNMAGLLLMHYGVKTVVNKTSKKKEYTNMALVSLIYTMIMALLLKLGWLKMPLDYFSANS